MPTQDLNKNSKKVNLRYILLPLTIGAFLVAFSLLSERTVSQASGAGFIGDTPTNVWTVIKMDAEVSGTPEPVSQHSLLTNVDGPYTIFLPIIIKNTYEYDPDGTLVLKALWQQFTLSLPVANVAVTITPPNPTTSVTPGTGTATAKPSITPTATGTATPNLVPDGDFEGDNAFHWRTFSLRDHPVIFDSSNPSLPKLPIDPFSPTKMAWLGGDDSEITYIEANIFLPLDKPYIFHQYYIHSVDPVCSENLFSGVTRRTQFQFANANSVNNLQSDVGGLIITDGSLVGVFVIDLCTVNGTDVSGSIVYDTLAFAGKNVTIRFQMVGDSQLTSSFFIDDVALRSDFSPTIVDFIKQSGEWVVVAPELITGVGPVLPAEVKELNSEATPIPLLELSPFQK